MFDCSGKVTVTCRWDPNEWKMNRKNKVFLVDEGEEVIERRLLDVKKEGFQGLLGLRDMRVFLFSATLTDYFRECWRRAFQENAKAVREFPTSHQVRSNVKYYQDVKVSLRRTKNDALQSMLDKVRVQMEQ